MNPDCPKGFSCTFTAEDPPYDGPWWESTAGIWVGVLGIFALTVIVITLGYYWWQYRDARLAYKERERRESYELAIEEQRTLQLDACKGNPELYAMAVDLGSKSTRR